MQQHIIIIQNVYKFLINDLKANSVAVSRTSVSCL